MATKEATIEKAPKAVKTVKKTADKVKETASVKKTETKPKSDNFAVVMTGGKQFLAHEGDILTIEKLAGKEFEKGDKIVLDNVLLTDSGSRVVVGSPSVGGAKVEGEVLEAGLGKKTLVIRYRSKSRHFKKYGHRQPFIKLRVTKVA